MSLINQVLRDLERREPSLQAVPTLESAPIPAPTADPTIAPLPVPGQTSAESAPSPTPDALAQQWAQRETEESGSRLPLIAAAGLAALLVVGGGVWWMSHGAPAPSSATAPAPAAPVARAIDFEPDPKAEVPALPEPAPAPAPVPAAPTKPVASERTAAAKPVIKAVAAAPKPVPAPAATAAVATPTASKPAPVQPPQSATVPRAEQLFQQAQNELKQGQADAGLNSLRAALEADAKHVQARLHLARVLTERKQPAAAADLLADGIMLQPQQNAFVLALAPLWFQAGQQDDALALLAQSTKHASASPQLTSYYGAQLLRLKRPAEAIPQFRAALRSDPSQPDWLIGLGLALQSAGQNQEAIEVFRRAYETGKLNPERKDLVEQMIAGLKSKP